MENRRGWGRRLPGSSAGILGKREMSDESVKEPIWRRVEVLRSLLQAGESISFVVRGGSMGERMEGVRVELRRGAGRLWPGDLVAYVDSGGNVVVHRWLIAAWIPGRGTCHLLQGDAALEADGWVPAGRLLAKVVAMDPVAAGVWPVSPGRRWRSLARGLRALAKGVAARLLEHRPT